MPAIAAVAIPAAAAVVGGVISSRAQGKAAKAQENAAREAIAYEERRQAAAEKQRATSAANWQKRYDAYLKQYYGWEPPAGSGGGGGVSASSAGSAGAPPGFASAGVGSAYQQGDNIPALMQRLGQIQAGSAQASGNAWGGAITQAGSGIGQALQKRPTAPQATLAGEFQPTGVSPQQAGINAWQPAPMGRGPQDDWSNWQRYFGQGG